MKISTLQVLKACTLSVALIGSAAIVAAIAMPDAAYAKSGNGNGNGNGGGNGNGNGGGKGNGSAKPGGGAVEKSTGGKASKEKSAAKSKAAAKSKKPSLADELGLSPSELGALNAAHANPNALKNAAPNSRVGRIAAYRDAVLAGEELAADLAEKAALLETLTPPARSSAVVGDDLSLAEEDLATKAAAVSELEAQQLALGGEGVDPTLDSALEAARVELTAAEGAEATLQDEYDAALAYETLSTEVDDLTQQVEDQPALERSLLEAAANKPVTDAVEAAVKALLGL